MTIAIHATCWALAFRPGLVESMQTLGRRLGLDMVVPKRQTCCGLPAWDAGQIGAAGAAARQTLKVFEGFEAVVTPSPACGRMLTEHMPALLAAGAEGVGARQLAEKTVSWGRFLVERNLLAGLDLRFEGRIAYFRPCTQQDDAAHQLLNSIGGSTLLPDPRTQCCGWGNQLGWRHPDISQAMAEPVSAALRLSGADVIVTDDVGCLLQLAPLLAGHAPPIRHVAEFLEEIC